MKIVLDTSIIVSDFWLRGNTFKIFLENIDRAGHSLFTPIIVLDEVANKYCERLRESLRQIEKAHSAINQLVNQNIRLSLENLNIDRAVKEYRQYLEYELKDSRFTFARIIFYPNVLHEQLVKRALERRKPFSDKGIGYRDALIWYGILWVAETYGIQNEPIAFISQNTSDFADSANQLHPDLTRDLIDRNLAPNSVLFYPNLKSFIEDQIISLLEQLDNLPDQLNVGGAREDWFRTEFLQSLSRELPLYGADQIDTSLPKEFENLVILKIVDLLKYRILNARRSNSITSSYLVLEVDAQLICEISVSIDNVKLSFLCFRDYPPLSIKDSGTHLKITVKAMINISVLLIHYEPEEFMVAEPICVTLLECY